MCTKSNSSSLFSVSTGKNNTVLKILGERGVNSLHFDRLCSSPKYADTVAKAFLTDNTAERLSVTQAKKILGKKNVLGVNEVNRVLGGSFKKNPDILFSRQELVRAKELDQFLIFRIPELPDGNLVTMSNLANIFQPIFEQKCLGKVLRNPPSESVAFFNTDMPRFGWSLVSKKPVLSSAEQYLEQTKRLMKYLIEEVFVDQELSAVYKDAIVEFQSEYTEKTYSHSDLSKLLSGLQINQLCRRLPVEVMYDSFIYLLNNEERLLDDIYDCTLGLDTDKNLVAFGLCNANGAAIKSYKPNYGTWNFGACFARQKICTF